MAKSPSPVPVKGTTGSAAPHAEGEGGGERRGLRHDERVNTGRIYLQNWYGRENVEDIYESVLMSVRKNIYTTER